MRKVLVTGAGGLLGRYVVDNLREGYDVIGLDTRRPDADCAFIEADITDLDAVKSAVRGVDAVVHIAAAANISSGTPEQIIDINVRGSWNMLEAASLAGVQRVVLCSSDSVMGNTVWQEYFWPPEYLPVDEDHPLRPTDPYALSKLLAEEAGRSYAARSNMQVLALRPVFILFPSMMGEVRARLADPEGYRGPCAGGHVGAGGGLCWHHIAPEDVASAFRCGLEYDYRGFDRFYLCAHSTLYPTPTLDRVQSFFGALPARVDRDRYAVNPYAPLYDTSHARDRLGWTPQHDLRAQVVDRARP